MRYTEKDYNYEYGDMKDWLQNAATLVIVAPLRLVNEISCKVIYLERALISQILNLAVLIHVIFTSLFIGIHVILGTFSLYLGKVPVLLQLMSLAGLLLIDVWYHMYDFIIYKHLSALLPIAMDSFTEEDESSKTSTAEVQEGTVQDADSSMTFEKMEESILTELQGLHIPDVEPITPIADIGTITSKLADNSDDLTDVQQMEDVSPSIRVEDIIITPKENNDIIDLSQFSEDLRDIINEELLTDETTIDYQNQLGSELEQLSVLDDVVEASLETEMEAATDPSKYVSEDALFMFLSDLGAEDMGAFSDITKCKIPDDFTLVF